MTIAIECTCGGEAVFFIDGQETSPTAECDACGQVYRMSVKKIPDEVSR